MVERLHLIANCNPSSLKNSYFASIPHCVGLMGWSLIHDSQSAGCFKVCSRTNWALSSWCSLKLPSDFLRETTVSNPPYELCYCSIILAIVGLATDCRIHNSSVENVLCTCWEFPVLFATVLNFFARVLCLFVWLRDLIVACFLNNFKI